MMGVEYFGIGVPGDGLTFGLDLKSQITAWWTGKFSRATAIREGANCPNSATCTNEPCGECDKSPIRPGTVDMSDVIERLNRLEREAGSRVVYYSSGCCDDPCGECEGDDDDSDDSDDKIELELWRCDWWEASDGIRWKVMYEDDDNTFLIARVSGADILQRWVEGDGVFYDGGEEFRLVRKVDGPFDKQDECSSSDPALLDICVGEWWESRNGDRWQVLIHGTFDDDRSWLIGRWDGEKIDIQIVNEYGHSRPGGGDGTDLARRVDGPSSLSEINVRLGGRYEDDSGSRWCVFRDDSKGEFPFLAYRESSPSTTAMFSRRGVGWDCNVRLVRRCPS